MSLLVALPVLVLADDRADSASRQCLTDLDAIPSFMLENDAGAKDELAQLGQAHFDTALAQAREQAAHASDDEACDRIIKAYLKAWRKGHLALMYAPGSGGKDTPPAHSLGEVKPEWLPTVRALSAQTALLTLPSFGAQYRQPLITLLKQHHSELAARANWIIDVRGNGGGSDSTYESLLPWLLPDERQEVGADWLATPANIAGQEQMCALVNPGDPQCLKFAEEAAARMRLATPGSYIAQEEGPAIQYLRVEKAEPRRPRRVVVLIDQGCGSSCEEFLLTVRQAFAVKLVGQHSAGTLDYSNLRPHTLPSGRRILMYATSRSHRLPGLPVDVAGIQPDVYLPAPATPTERNDGLIHVQRWLETGSFAVVSKPQRP
jgi:hypothetical protein